MTGILPRKTAIVVAGALLSGCGGGSIPGAAVIAPSTAAATSGGEMPDPVPAGSTTEPSVRASYPERPARLLERAASACAGPGQRVVAPDPDTLRCESLPEPDAAAALILAYDGDLEDLPRFVIQFAGESRPQDYVMRAESFIMVPRRDGSVVEIRPRSEPVLEGFARLLAATGGEVM